MSSADNVDIARSSYEAFGRGDLDGALAMMDDDIEWHQAQGLPHGGVYRGLANVRAAIFDPLGEEWWEDFDATPAEFLGGGTTSSCSGATRGGASARARRSTSRSRTSGASGTAARCASTSSRTRAAGSKPSAFPDLRQ